MSKHQIRVVTVDAQSIYRAGIRHILATLPQVNVVGEAGCCADAYVQCERLRPDLLLIDIAMSGSLELIAQLRERFKSLRVVVLTECVDEALLSQALQLDIAGYLLKHLDAFEFAQAIRSAAGGLLTLANLLEVTAAVVHMSNHSASHPDDFSEREQAVLALLLHGLSNDAIATKLHISRTTVKFHLRNIYGKLGVRTRVEAISKSYRQHHGLTNSSGERLPTLSQQALRVAMKGM